MREKRGVEVGMAFVIFAFGYLQLYDPSLSHKSADGTNWFLSCRLNGHRIEEGKAGCAW